MSNKLSEVLLITEELLKLYSDISRNVSVDKVIPYVNLAQPFYIEPILGEPLTRELQKQIKDGEVTAENKALILKVAPALALYTQYLAMRGLAYSVTQKGLTKEKSENSESISKEELTQWRNDTLNQADMAADLLVRYLCKCRDLYPLWFPANDCKCSKYEENEGLANAKKINLPLYDPYHNNNKGCGCK